MNKTPNLLDAARAALAALVALDTSEHDADIRAEALRAAIAAEEEREQDAEDLEAAYQRNEIPLEYRRTACEGATIALINLCRWDAMNDDPPQNLPTDPLEAWYAGRLAVTEHAAKQAAFYHPATYRRWSAVERVRGTK